MMCFNPHHLGQQCTAHSNEALQTASCKWKDTTLKETPGVHFPTLQRPLLQEQPLSRSEAEIRE